MPLFLPQHLLEKRLDCRACKRQMPIPFKQEQREVIEPILPNNFHPLTNNVEWVCTSTEVKCEHCGEAINLPLPIVKRTSAVYLFADEASRLVNGRNIWVFTAVGCDRRLLPKIEDRIREFKGAAFPNVAPDTWTMHMKDIWSGNARAKHPLFSTMTREDVIKYIANLGVLFSDLQSEMFTFACVSVRPTSYTAENPMHLAFSVLFSEFIHGFTKRGSAPYLHLDAQRPASIQSQIVGWIESILTEQRHVLAYPFLTHGITIPKPTILKPGSAPCAELADAMAFWIARYHERRWRGLAVEVEPAVFGKVFYVVERKPGEVLVTRQPNFPWDMCYGGAEDARS